MFTRPRIPPASSGRQRPDPGPDDVAALVRRSSSDLSQLLGRANRDSASRRQAALAPLPRARVVQQPLQNPPAFGHTLDQAPPRRTEGVWREIAKMKAALLVGLLGAGMLALYGAFAGHKAATQADRTAQETTTVKKNISELAERQVQFQGSTALSLKQLSETVGEVKYPPSEYLDAVNAFREGRYFEAENGFRVFLLKHPNSKVADKALLNAAASAAMQGRCSMTSTYLAQLKTKHANSPHIADASAVVAKCRALSATH